MSYQKPLALMNDDLAEGVYAASGAASANDYEVGASAGAAASYTLNKTGDWDGNKNYDISITNNLDHKVDSITVTVNVNGVATAIDGNVTGTVSGNTATITFNNYGNGINAGETVTTYMHVTGTGDFSLS